MSLTDVNNEGRQLATPTGPAERTTTALFTADLNLRLEKLSRHYDVETMKMFMVVEALGESNIHAVYNPLHKTRWQPFLQRQEACRVDHSKHERTRQHYQHFLKEVGREDQGRQWFVAVLRLLHGWGASDVFHYLTANASSLASSPKHSHLLQRGHHLQHQHSTSNSPRKYEALPLRHSHLPNPQHHRGATDTDTDTRQANGGEWHGHGWQHEQPVPALPGSLHNGGGGSESEFCKHLVKLFEKKLKMWFDSFHAVAVRLTAHVKVAGLVRVLTGQVHALVTRQGRLTALVIKVTQQEVPRPLDVAELCLHKVMVIQNGLAGPEELGLGLLVLHVHPARPVLRLWQLTPSTEMETAIRTADIDDMIEAGRLDRHELWAENTTTLTLPLPPQPPGQDDPLTDRE